jgi:hypothetical protein
MCSGRHADNNFYLRLNLSPRYSYFRDGFLRTAIGQQYARAINLITTNRDS